jgi:hypothetical protein
MNNVTAKKEIIGRFIQVLFIFLAWIILMFIQPRGFLGVFMFILPLFFLLSLMQLIGILPHADISIDEPKDMLIVTTLFTKREIRLEDFKIEDHSFERMQFRVYTNSKDIVMFRDIKSYDALIKLFELKNYKGSKYFNVVLMRSFSRWGLHYLPGATLETYEKIKMRAGMNDIK